MPLARKPATGIRASTAIRARTERADRRRARVIGVSLCGAIPLRHGSDEAHRPRAWRPGNPSLLNIWQKFRFIAANKSLTDWGSDFRELASRGTAAGRGLGF